MRSASFKPTVPTPHPVAMRHTSLLVMRHTSLLPCLSDGLVLLLYLIT